MRRWQKILAASFARHEHESAYAAVVLRGGYEEAGDHGRFRVRPGDVLLHDRFDAHVDRFSDSGAVVLNLPLQPRHAFVPGAAKLPDPDHIAVIAERDHNEAVDCLLSVIQTRASEPHDWPDELASALARDSSLYLGRWAEQKDLAPWTLSRGFLQVFGITPEAFRARARTRCAWKRILATSEPLVEIAYRCGFSDQSHMTRSVCRLTGSPPSAWRTAANGCKTSQPPHA